MLRILPVMVIIAYQLLSCCRLPAQQAAFLPQFNYWELSVELLLRKPLRETLDIAPAQIVAIEKMRSREDFSDILREKMREMRGSPTEAWAALDSVVAKELAKILADEQMSGLRVLAMRRRYQFGFSPFEDPHVLRQCKLTSQEQNDLDRIVGSEKEKFFAYVEELRIAGGKRVLQAASTESTKRFVQYAGNKYFSELQVDADSAVLDVHRTTFRSLSLFESYLPALRKTMSSKEVEIAAAILAKYSTSSQSFKAQEKYKSMLDFLNAMETNGGQEIEASLSQATLAAFGRMHAAFEFDNDFGVPFEKQSVVSYLQLTPTQLEQIKSTAKVENATLQTQIAELNERTFQTLCASLGPESRTRMNELFKDVWKLGRWDN